MMEVHIEFYGIPRQRTQVGEVALPLSQSRISLGEVIRQLAERFPALAKECLSGNTLAPTTLVSLDGRRFVRDPETVICDGDRLLLLTADPSG